MDKENIEIPFGAKDSELKGWEYTISEGMMAEIKDGKIIVREKESEDERIRSFLYEFIKICDWSEKQYPPREKCLAYLEKQKDHFRDDTKMIEQKPVDDKAFEEWIDDWWKHNKVNNPDSYDKGDEIQFDEKGFKNFCRGIRNMYANRESAEWSEEDKRKLNRIYEILGHAADDKGFLKSKRIIGDKEAIELQDFLKSLRPQPKEQYVEKYPEDKSFEDEWKDYYNNSLVSRLPMNIREVAKHFYWFSKKNAWKPSEEQIAILEKVKDYYYNHWTGATIREQKTLASLLADLQKLL